MDNAASSFDSTKSSSDSETVTAYESKNPTDIDARSLSGFARENASFQLGNIQNSAEIISGGASENDCRATSATVTVAEVLAFE